MDDREDDSVVDTFEIDLNQLREARPDLTHEKLDADGIVDFDRDVATNESQPLSVVEVVNEYLPELVKTVEGDSSDKDEVPDEPISPPSRNEVDEGIEILNKLTLFTNRFGSRSVTSESLKQNKSICINLPSNINH